MEAITIILLFFYFVRQCNLAKDDINTDLHNEALSIAENEAQKLVGRNEPITDKDELFIKKWSKIGHAIIRTILAMLSIASIIYVMQLN